MTLAQSFSFLGEGHRFSLPQLHLNRQSSLPQMMILCVAVSPILACCVCGSELSCEEVFEAHQKWGDNDSPPRLAATLQLGRAARCGKTAQDWLRES